MRELDLILGRYLETDYRAAPPPARAAFEALLELPDPVILDYVLGRDRPDDLQQRYVIERCTALRVQV